MTDGDSSNQPPGEPSAPPPAQPSGDAGQTPTDDGTLLTLFERLDRSGQAAETPVADTTLVSAQGSATKREPGSGALFVDGCGNQGQWGASE